MKLATLNDGTRDGRLAVVSADGSAAAFAEVVRSLREALDKWPDVEPALRAQSCALAAGSLSGSFPFDPAQALAPLPIAPQWLDASAYRTHSELIAEAWQTANRFSDAAPLMYQGASDDFRPAHGPSYLPDESHDIDFEAELAVIVDAVPMGVDAAAALDHIRFVVLLDDVSLRAFGPREQQSGFGFLQAKPSTVFAPLAVSPDELGTSWKQGRLDRPVTAWVNGTWIGSPNAVHMTFSFGDLIAHAAKTRRLSAGTVIGSGTVSDPDRGAGSATLIELRAVEQLKYGAPRTPFLRFGDRVEIDVLDDHGRSVFGRIDHLVLQDPGDHKRAAHA